MKTIFSSRRYHYVARVSIFLIMVALIAGMVRCTAEVTASPVINYFTADPESISAGESSKLSWDVSGATEVTIDHGIGSKGVTGTLTVSPTTTTTYTLEASNEKGSSTATVQVTVSAPSLPDLTITTGNPTVTPPTAAPGETVSLSAWTVKNQGNADSGSFDNGFYLSTDPVITASDTYLDGNSSSNLAPGVQYDWDGPTLTIPSGTPLGDYYIGILVDRTNEVSESDEDNNYVASPITVSAPSFAVTKVQCKSCSPSGTPTCPFTISYTFDITTNGAGTVSYHFERSDGYLSAATTLSFTGAGTKTVSYSWTVGASGSYAVLCRTTAPNEMSDDSPPVTVTCSFAVTEVECKSYSASGTHTCPYTISYTFDITTNGAGTVGYDFERSDGYLSAAGTLSFTGAGTKTVSYTWTVGASGSYAVLCRTAAPNEMSDDSPPVAVTCS
jgi:hypothetical protein